MLYGIFLVLKIRSVPRSFIETFFFKEIELVDEKIPARLHVILAREASIGVVFRRGPSKRVCTFLWDREKDEFTIGQWLKGSIYEHNADISPDGKYMIQET